MAARLTAPLRPAPTPVVTALPGIAIVGMPGGPAPPALPSGAGPAGPPPIPSGSVGAPPTGPAGGPGAPPSQTAPLATAPGPALITSKEGDTLTLMTAAGPRRVRLADNTRIQKQVTAERDDLAPGQLVIVRGEPDGDELVAGTVELLGGPP